METVQWQPRVAVWREHGLRKRLIVLVRRPISNYTRPGLYSQGIFVVICAFCLKWWSVIPGVAVALLALAACVMAVRADNFTSAEKAVWVAICFALCFIELRTIYGAEQEFVETQ
jgi:hypothetical protein